jgi:CDP-diacylglycerol--serine O-phosphatidyltransferase
VLGNPDGRLRFFRRESDKPRQTRARRGVYLLPSLLTMGNMWCGYASIVYSLRGDFETAAPLIGIAYALDALDGRIARLTGTESEFGLQLDSLADVISFGIAPAVMTFAWGLSSLGRLGWAAGFMFVACAAMRLARFNVLSASGGDKRYYVGIPSPAAAAVPAATVFMFHQPLLDYSAALPALAVVLLPAVLMVSSIKYRSFKDLDLKSRRSFRVLVIIAAGIVTFWTHPKAVLLVAAYTYLASGLVGLAISRFKRDRHPADVTPPLPPPAG